VKTVSVASAMRRCSTPSRLATMRVSVRHGYGCDAIDEMTNRGCGVAAALDVLHEACTTFLARTQAQRTIAARLEISLGTPGEAPPERRLAALVHSRLATVTPPRPWGSYAAVPDTNDLPQSDPTCRPLEAAQLEALRGQGTQWIVYVGKLLVNLASRCGDPGSAHPGPPWHSPATGARGGL
jgi:hypothetical protein